MKTNRLYYPKTHEIFIFSSVDKTLHNAKRVVKRGKGVVKLCKIWFCENEHETLVAKPSPILLPVDDSQKCGKRKNETTPKSISLSLSLSLSSLVCLWYTNYLVSMLGFVSVSILVSVLLVSTLQTHKRIGRPLGPDCCTWWMDCSAKVRVCVSCTASGCLVYSKCCTYGRRCWLLCVIRALVFRSRSFAATPRYAPYASAGVLRVVVG